ncbi:MAG: hypothetical protein ABI863_22540 [Ginsengibacter sp.]
MKSSNLKLSFLALSFFTCSAIFAQDTAKKPMPDTTNKPKPDTSKSKIGLSTSMTAVPNVLGNSNVDAINSFFITEDKIAAKKEEKKEQKIV